MADVQYVARFFIDMAQSQAYHGLGFCRGFFLI